jgi:hypothetical protein
MRRCFVFVLGAVLGSAVARADCQPPSGLSPCLDANSLWLATGRTRWFGLGAEPALAPGRVAVGAAVQLLESPLSFVVPSPDIGGREVLAIDEVVAEDTLLAVGLGHHFELGVALGMILYQRGAGGAGLDSQRGAPLPRAAVRDPRLSLAYFQQLGSSLAVKPRLELSVPLGDSDAYASSGAFGVAPALPLSWSAGPVAVGAELALRLRPAIELGSLRWGSQAGLGLGVAVDVLPERWLALAAEGFWLRSLIDDDSARAQALGVSSNVAVAEWLASARSHPERGAPWSVALGIGGGLPLSTQIARGETEHFTAPGSPRLRLLAEIRYAPED